MEKVKKTYNFGEKKQEKDTKTQEMLEVWQTPKYIESKEKATEMINSEKYGLSEADFWILKNRAGDKMAYTGLIISHNGCLKVNDTLDNKVDPKCFSLDKEGYANSLVYTYIDEDTYEVGEFNSTNGKNAYPYAMAFKRCFDRVVLKKSKLAYAGIYSEVEADEFKKEQTEDMEHLELISQFNDLAFRTCLNIDALYEKLGLNSNAELSHEKLKELITSMEKKLGGK